VNGSYRFFKGEPVPRNPHVEAAVTAAVGRIDTVLADDTLRTPLPSKSQRRACEDQLSRSGSIRLASLFLAFYALEDSTWDFRSVPTGVRGKYGDKLLSEELSRRHITLHDAIVAFGENLGWKGNVREFDLSTDPRFEKFCGSLEAASPTERATMASYLAARFAESRREAPPLPAVGDDVLTFARSRVLFSRLLALSTEGHVQQFIVSAMLRTARAPFGIEVRTHHPHAADKFDRTAGDIEEFYQSQLLRAYEVTVRADWKTRLSSFRSKMDRFGLHKYVIIASSVNEDEDLRVPADLLAFLAPLERDIAVVDIEDFINVFAAQMSARQLREAVNLTYEYLVTPALCGRVEFQEAYVAEVNEWLDDR